MGSPKQTVCFICLINHIEIPSTSNPIYHNQVHSPINKNEADTSSTTEAHQNDILIRFVSLINQCLGINSEHYSFLNLRNKSPQNSVNQDCSLFCEICAKVVSQICDLYHEFCIVQLRLSSRLGELGELMVNSKIKSAAGDSQDDNDHYGSLLKSLAYQLGTENISLVDEVRRVIASKCELKRRQHCPEVALDNLPPPSKASLSTSPQQCVAPKVTLKLEDGRLSSDDEEDDDDYQRQDYYGGVNTPIKIVEADDDEYDSDFENEQMIERIDQDQDSNLSSDSNVQQDPLKQDLSKEDKKVENRKDKNPPQQTEDVEASDSDDDEDESQSDSDYSPSEGGDSDPEWNANNSAPSPASKKPKPQNQTQTQPKAKRKREDDPSQSQPDGVLLLYECVKCQTTVPSIKWKGHLAWHKGREKAEQHPFHCKICLNIFVDQEALDFHINLLHPDMECKYCGAKFKNRLLLLKHKSSEHPNRNKERHKCTLCEKVFEYLDELRLHKKNSHQIRIRPIIPCNLCDKTFTKKMSLLEHIKSVHNDKRDHLCQQCGKAFKTEKKLKDHISRKHFSEKDPDYGKKGKNPCPYCEKRFGVKYQLYTHLKKCENNPNIQSDDYQPEPSICDQCGKEFRDSRSCKVHVYQKHR
ncbi:unnamed protein product [Orchesella dallaii]|uniref:C2H2-type domain-containing protein n=1 Tax=Orchesella dallaii TaxID=48710 RepID=A0ABP1RHS7_9HEXA